MAAAVLAAQGRTAAQEGYAGADAADEAHELWVGDHHVEMRNRSSTLVI